MLYFAGSTKKKKVRKHAEMQHYDNKKTQLRWFGVLVGD